VFFIKSIYLFLLKDVVRASVLILYGVQIQSSKSLSRLIEKGNVYIDLTVLNRGNASLHTVDCLIQRCITGWIVLKLELLFIVNDDSLW
jgi:hypothetical protein